MQVRRREGVWYDYKKRMVGWVSFKGEKEHGISFYIYIQYIYIVYIKLGEMGEESPFRVTV